MTVSIIIVNYNTRKLLKECIQSLVNSISGIEYEVIVVDNDSKDNSNEMLKKEFPWVKLIANRYNAGFAKANNQGYFISSGKYVLLLNSDTIVQKDGINKLIDFMERRKDVIISGPKLLNTDRTLQYPCRRGFPRFINSIAHFTKLSRVFFNSKVLGSYHMTYMDSNSDHEVDAVSGACLIIRRKDIDRIGGLLDEKYFMHFEDMDLCYRVKQAGGKVYYLHDAEVIHLKGQSSMQRSFGVSMNFYQSALIYFRKNYRHENLLAYYLLVAMIYCMKLSSIMSFRLFRRKSKLGNHNSIF